MDIPDADDSLEPPRTGRLTRRRVLGAGAAALALTVGRGVYEADALEVTRYRVRTAGVAEPLRVVQISDMHRSEMVPASRIRAAVDAANALHPDVVAVTGDFVSSSLAYVPSCVAELARLKATRGIWAVPGNHDAWARDSLKRGLGAVGIDLLINRWTRISGGLALAGVDDPIGGWPDVAQTYAGIPPGAPIITLSHNPGMLGRLGAARRSVILAGHTHGGQVNFPGRYLFTRGGFNYLRGWYERNNARLYVNRGIGLVYVPVRLGARPEVTLFEMVGVGPNEAEGQEAI